MLGQLNRSCGNYLAVRGESMTLRRGESCGGGVHCTMVGHKRGGSTAAKDSGLRNVPLVAVGEGVAIGFRTAEGFGLSWWVGMMGKEKRSTSGSLLNFFCADKSCDKKPVDCSRQGLEHVPGYPTVQPAREGGPAAIHRPIEWSSRACRSNGLV